MDGRGALQLGEFNADLAIVTGHVAQFHLEDEYWLAALNAIHKALRPGGHLAFESRNPAVQPWTIKAGHSDWPVESSRRGVTDPLAGQIEWWTRVLAVKDERVSYEIHYFFAASGEELVSVNELRFRTCAEIEQSLEDAGFAVENVLGNWNHSPAVPEEPEFIFVAGRK